MKAIELFSGCGAMAYGLCEAGMHPLRMVEANPHAIATLNHNKLRDVKHARHWPFELGDVRDADWLRYRGTVQIVAGGPPCQPFSLAGKSLGSRDARDMWPEAIRAVDEISPDAFLFENVRGLMRPVFASYFAQILSRLTGSGEDGYDVIHGMVDAADHGAPQRRHRVIVAGFRKGLSTESRLLQGDHSRDRLLWDQWVDGSYWREHGVRQPGDDKIPNNCRGRVAALRASSLEPVGKRWRTVRDGLYNLGLPNGESCHVFQPGARSYPGHTGSELDQPAKALKAGMHGVPGGENMLKLPNGSVRYFTVREMARLQGLPDEFEFPGTWTESTRQLGNAVPVPLAKSFGEWVMARLDGERQNLAA